MTGLAMIKFFSAVLGITLASGAIAAELERGTLYVILSKPLTRTHILLGKWLGLVILTAVNVGVWAALLWLAVYVRMPGPHWPLLEAVGLAFRYPLIFVTLTLCFSTFASNVLATALALVSVGIGWQEGIMRQMGRIFDIRLLREFGIFAGYLVPIGRLHRWMIHVADLTSKVGYPTRPISRSRSRLARDRRPSAAARAGRAISASLSARGSCLIAYSRRSARPLSRQRRTSTTSSGPRPRV